MDILFLEASRKRDAEFAIQERKHAAVRIKGGHDLGNGIIMRNIIYAE